MSFWLARGCMPLGTCHMGLAAPGSKRHMGCMPPAAPCPHICITQSTPILHSAVALHTTLGSGQAPVYLTSALSKPPSCRLPWPHGLPCLTPSGGGEQKLEGVGLETLTAAARERWGKDLENWRILSQVQWCLDQESRGCRWPTDHQSHSLNLKHCRLIALWQK